MRSGSSRLGPRQSTDEGKAPDETAENIGQPMDAREQAEDNDKGQEEKGEAFEEFLSLRIFG